MIIGVLVTLGTVFLAELGDKTQFLAVSLGSRVRLKTALLGLAVGYAVASLVAAGIGALLGGELPVHIIRPLSGAVFIALGVVAMAHTEDEEQSALRRIGVLTIAAAIAIGELGDKTQVATLALATTRGFIPTWIGATIGETLAGALGLVVGNKVAGRLDARVVRYTSSAVFIVLGVVLVAQSL
jgi:putative Ca2+/H+ antiporter (TMEM165/GDT1 family)